MADIHSATAEIRRGKKERRRRKKEQTTGWKYNGLPHTWPIAVLGPPKWSVRYTNLLHRLQICCKWSKGDAHWASISRV